MTILFSITFFIVILCLCDSSNNVETDENYIIDLIEENAFTTIPHSRDWVFHTTISRLVLENYLDRSVSIEGLLNGRGDLKDNIRMLKHIGAKYIGRSLCLWGMEAQLINNIERTKQQMPLVRSIDPNAIFEACIFEIVTMEVNGVHIPDWAFVALRLNVTDRNFNYNGMIYLDGKFVNQWGKGKSVPDVSRLETKIWFYFLARTYIDLGFEAIHHGQVELMNHNDPHLEHFSQMFELYRQYARHNAKRGMILLNAHVPSGGLLKDGKLLLDFHAFPLRIKEEPEQPYEAILQIHYKDAFFGRSRGGFTYSNWTCEQLPYLVEFDNYGVSNHPGHANDTEGGFWVWGYDEITWFAHQNKTYRRSWLEYAFIWLNQTDPNGHLEMPGGRTEDSPQDHKKWYTESFGHVTYAVSISKPLITEKPLVTEQNTRPERVRLPKNFVYYANDPSAIVPDGLGDEDAVNYIWDKYL